MAARIVRRYRAVFDADRLLPVLFVAVTLEHLSTFPSGVVGIDARIYYRAAALWLHGASPWDALATHVDGGQVYHFAALPTTVVVLAPFTLLPEELFLWAWVGASAAAAIWITRRLRLAWWYVLFPPLVLGVVSGNPQILLLALLVSGKPVLEALAPMLKVYAIIPIVFERRWRTLIVAVLITLLTVALASPLWMQYAGHSDLIAQRLAAESGDGYSAWAGGAALIALAAVGLGLLAVADARAAGWLLAPAVFPSTQFHISTMGLPVISRRHSHWLAVGLALPLQGMPALVIATYGIWVLRDTLQQRRRGGSPGDMLNRLRRKEPIVRPEQ